MAEFKIITEGHLPWAKGWEEEYLTPQEFVESDDYDITIVVMTTNERRIVTDTPFSKRLKEHKGRVGFYIHSTRAQINGPELFSLATWTEQELLDKFEYLLTGTPSVAKAIEKKFGKKVMAVGLPIRLPKPLGIKKQNIVAVNQRLQDDNQPYLLLGYIERRPDLRFRILQHITWEIPKPIERRFLAMDNVEIIVSESREKYLASLEECDTLLSFTFSETFSVSLVEAIALGLSPIFPDVLGVEDIVTDRYEPYSLIDIDRKLKEKSMRVEPYYGWLVRTPFSKRLKDVGFLGGQENG